MDLALIERLSPLRVRGLIAADDQRLTPNTVADVREMLQWAHQHHQPLAFNAHEAQAMEAPLWMDLSGIRKIRQYPAEDFVIQVETGIRWGDLNERLQQKHQAFPLSYPSDWTLGQVLADDRPALETGLRGYPRDYVLKTELLTPDGHLSVSGADVVKNATGYDLAKLYVGARNTLGVLTAVTLKLSGKPPKHRAWLIRFAHLQQAIDITPRLLNAPWPLNRCELFQDDQGQWQAYIQLSGPGMVLDQADAVLNACLHLPTPSSPTNATPQPVARPLPETEAQPLIQHLQGIGQSGLTAEIAVPLGQWGGLLQALHQYPDLAALRYQVRPAAGLIWVTGDTLNPDTLRRLRPPVSAQQGMLHLTHLPQPDLTLLAEFNRPADPVVARLLRRIKAGFDPHQVLFCPYLPLEAPSEPITEGGPSA